MTVKVTPVSPFLPPVPCRIVVTMWRRKNKEFHQLITASSTAGSSRGLRGDPAQGRRGDNWSQAPGIVMFGMWTLAVT